MSRTRTSSLVIGLLGLIALAAAACSSSPANPNAASTTTTTTAASTTTTAAEGTTTTTTAASTSTTSGAIQNLQVSSAVRSTLTSVYVNYRHFNASDISGTTPNSVYYAYDPSTQTYWAMASFMPSSTASQQVLVGMQDGGETGLYKMTAGGSWSIALNGEPPYCGEMRYFPQPVLAAWNMGTAPAGLVC